MPETSPLLAGGRLLGAFGYASLGTSGWRVGQRIDVGGLADDAVAEGARLIERLPWWPDEPLAAGVDPYERPRRLAWLGTGTTPRRFLLHTIHAENDASNRPDNNFTECLVVERMDASVRPPEARPTLDGRRGRTAARERRARGRAAQPALGPRTLGHAVGSRGGRSRAARRWLRGRAHPARRRPRGDPDRSDGPGQAAVPPRCCAPRTAPGTRSPGPRHRRQPDLGSRAAGHRDGPAPRASGMGRHVRPAIAGSCCGARRKGLRAAAGARQPLWHRSPRSRAGHHCRAEPHLRHRPAGADDCGSGRGKGGLPAVRPVVRLGGPTARSGGEPRSAAAPPTAAGAAGR